VIWFWRALGLVYVAPIIFFGAILMVWYSIPPARRSELPERNGAVLMLKTAVWPIYAVRWLWWRWEIRKLTRLTELDL
jgi:hypothetical protein